MLTKSIFFVVFLSYISSVEINAHCEQQLFRQSHRGNRLANHHINLNQTVSSSIECAYLCLEQDCAGFNYQEKQKKEEINCQLSNSADPSFMANDDMSWEFYEVQSVSRYGSKENPGKSCADILTKKCSENVRDGIYWIALPSSSSAVFPVLCDMANGGWTLIFKGIAGVPGTLFTIWENTLTSYENVTDALNKENSFKNHYKNRIVQHWSAFNPAQARVVLYTNAKEDLVLTFNAQNTNNLEWFADGNLLSSPWTDIKSASKNIFSLKGYCLGSSSARRCRNFYMSANHGGCSVDSGWLMTGNLNSCAWEKRLPEIRILYSWKPTKVNWNHYGDVSTSDVFAVYLR